MRLVLDSGALTALAVDRARLRALLDAGLWPAEVPSVVLVEALTGDPRRDHATERLLRDCRVRDVGASTARAAARLRTRTGRAGTISAVDAIVVAWAASTPDSVVLTGDPRDLQSLAVESPQPVRVVPLSG